MEGVLAVLLALGWIALIAVSGRKRTRASKGGIGASGAKFKEDDFKNIAIHRPFGYLMDKTSEWKMLQHYTNQCHGRLMVLNGPAWSPEKTKSMLAEGAGAGYAALCLCQWIAWIAGEPTLCYIAVLLFAALALRPYMEAGRNLEARRRQIVAALPDRLSKLILLVGAGETVQGAFRRCVDVAGEQKHPLDREWAIAAASLANGESFQAAMERFGRQCAVQEASVFTTVLLLNYKRGGEHFTLALRELSFTLWEKRKAVARTRGEEASSKLVFPLVGILMILMVLVGAPAILLMA